MPTPSDSNKSALPLLDDTLRPPCLATLAPAAAETNTVALEMLKVLAPSPPVPTISSRCVLSCTCTGVARSRITVAAPAISPTVSFFTRRPVSIAEVMTGETSPRMMAVIRSIISSKKISRCSMVRRSASCGVIAMDQCSSRKLRSKACPCSVRMDSGWNCTPCVGYSRWRSPMIMPFSSQALTCRHLGKVSRSTISE